MTTRWFLALCLLGLTLAGCGTPTPYFLIESRLVENRRSGAAPDVTETSSFRAVREDVRTLALRPPDVCADQGLSASGGVGQLQLGVMRTRCGVEMAELERALVRAGYQVVSWNAVQQQTMRRDKPILEAAAELEIDVLLQINALERIDVQKGIDIRWERRFYEATRTGVRRDPTSVDPSRAEDFESLIARKEALLTSGKRIGATINVSAVWVGSGATIWFYDWIVVDEARSDQRAEILVDCDDAACRELNRPSRAVSTGPVQGSISGFSTAGYPEDETQAIFSGLVRRLVTDLAERFAGRRS